MIDLIARLEAATGPDRQLDLDIRLGLSLDAELAETVKHRQGFDNKPGFAWELGKGAVLYQKRDEHGRCFYNGGHPIPAYTSSIDAALTLVPNGWSASVDTDGFASCWLSATDKGTSGSNDCNPAIGLCIAALKARHAISVTSNVRGEQE